MPLKTNRYQIDKGMKQGPIAGLNKIHERVERASMKTGLPARIKSWILSHPAMVVCAVLLCGIISLNYFIQLKTSPVAPTEKLEAMYPDH